MLFGALGDRFGKLRVISLAAIGASAATFICLANSQELDVSSLTFELADHLLADSLDPNALHADQTLHGV